MENFNHKEYRDGLAQDLKDLRLKEKPNLARTFLTVSKHTSRYKLAREKHREEKKVLKKEKEAGIESSIPEKDMEDMDSLVTQTIEMIEKDEGLDFMINIVGNLSEKSKETDPDFNKFNGSKQFYFDKVEHKLKETSDKNNEIYQSLEQVFDRSESSTQELFKAHYKVINAFYTPFFKKIERPFRVVVIRVPFKPQNFSNNFCRDDRDGVNLSFALQYINQIQNLDFPNEKIKEYLENPNSEEAKDFFLELFIQCGEKYIPEYLEFFFEQKRLYDEKNK